MKMYPLLLTAIILIGFDAQGTIPPTFKSMPLDVKYEIVTHLLDQRNVNAIMNDLNSLKLVDKSFYNLLLQNDSRNRKFKSFFELNKSKNIWKAIDLIKADQNIFKNYNLGDYLSKKFKYLTADQYNDALKLLNPQNAKKYMKKSDPLTENYFNDLIIRKNKLDVFKLLLIGAITDLNEVNTNDLTPLMHAVIIKDKDIINLLLDKGANINAENSRGYTALDIANTGYGNQEIISLLERKGGITR